MRELNYHETQWVSGGGLNLQTVAASPVAVSPLENVKNTGFPELDDLLTTVGAAFEKITSILNYYSNLFSPSGRKS